MAEPFTAKRGGLFIQPSGPNSEVFYLGCHTLGDITEGEGAIELLRCFNPEGTAWEVKGSTISPPDPVTFSVETHMTKTRSWIQRIEFPASFYVLQSETGRRDNFKNYDSGMVLADARRSSKGRTGVVAIEEDAGSMVTTEWEAFPPVHEIDELTIERKTTAATNALNDIWANPDSHDYASWGGRLYRGQLGLIAGESAVAPAVATLLFAEDYTDALAQSATAPFAAGASIMSGKFFYVGKTTRRYLAAMDAPAGGQGMVAYCDDDTGAAWVTVNIGGAVAGHGAVYGGGLWATSENFILLAGAGGYIYKSVDGGVTWRAVEDGAIAVTSYSCVHSPDGVYCIAGGPADNIVLSEDGGETWNVSAAVTGGGGDILCCWRFDENNLWVGTDDGELWYSADGGESWTERTRFTGTGVGDIRAMHWVNRHVGYVAHNSAAPVGTILRTINGGYDWEALATPANSGLNAIMAPEANLVYAVGEANAGTGFICRAKSVGITLPVA